MDIPQRLTPSIGELQRFYAGKDIKDIPKPAIVLDRALMRRNCQSLLKATQEIGVGFRAHVKTHKTVEGIRLQMGDSGREVRLVASTIAEFEHVLPVLREFQDAGRKVNMLYGIPLPPSQASRLASVARRLGPGTVSVLVDHPSQLTHVERVSNQAGFAVGVFLKIDTGYHRAGLPPSGINKGDLVVKLFELENAGKLSFLGLYSHSSLSYNDSTPHKAMANLEDEIEGCLETLQRNSPLFEEGRNITVSVGASPQVKAVENLARHQQQDTNDSSSAIRHLQEKIEDVAKNAQSGFRVHLELHAGVYSIMDVQQLAARPLPDLGECEQEIAVSVMAEVCSVYNDGERRQPEALVAVGVLGLGREPCVAYEGWGVVDVSDYSPGRVPERRLIVKRISQEHCIVSWARGTDSTADEQDEASMAPIPLEVGQSVRIYPNHACITGALYGWYCVVDSSQAERQNTVVDVWTRASGW